MVEDEVDADTAENDIPGKKALIIPKAIRAKYSFYRFAFLSLLI